MIERYVRRAKFALDIHNNGICTATGDEMFEWLDDPRLR
jgi:hypothetical protein